MIVVFAGCDKTGKTTLIKALHKATNYKYPILDRFTDSSIVYGKYRNRKLDYSKYYEIEKYLLEEVLLVYVTAENKDIKERIIKEKEKDITWNEIQDVKSEYINYIVNTFFNYIVINTSMYSKKECVKQIKDKIKEIEKEDGLEQIKTLVRTIKCLGEVVNKTLELRNINYNFKDIKFQKLKKFTNIKHEKYYYDRIYYGLRHIINSQIKEYNQNLYSRRFLFDSNECINSFHVLYRGDTLECYVNIRSSNVEKILPLDVYYSYRIAHRINKEFFKAKKVKINFKIISAHVYI